MTQIFQNVMLYGMPKDIVCPPEMIEILTEINAKGIDAQNQAFLRPAGRRSRECPKCGEEFNCEYTFVAYDGMIGAPMWHQSACNVCLGSWWRKDTPARERAREVPSYRDDFDFDKLPVKAQKVGRDFLKWTPEQEIGIGLIGLQDTGKSYLLHELGRLLENIGTAVAVVDDRAINEMVKPDGDRDRKKVLAKISRADVIIWDDFGTCRMTDSVEEFLNKALDFAYQSKTPIIAATNYTGEQLKQQWERQTGESSWRGVRGDKILKRLKDRCRMFAV